MPRRSFQTKQLLSQRGSAISDYFLSRYRERNMSGIIGYDNTRHKKPGWYHQLPKNVLIKIFGYFDERQLQRKIMLVCRQWRYAATDPKLWKNLEIRGNGTPSKHICSKLRSFTNLHNVAVEKVEEPEEIIRQICRSNPNITRLSMRYCPKISEMSLRHLIKCCVYLESLDMQGTPIKGNTCYVELGGLKHLKEINFSDNWYFTVNNLLAVVINCRTLEKLCVSKLVTSNKDDTHRPLQDEDVNFIVNHISPHLQSLLLDTSTLVYSTFEKILQCSELQHLGLLGASNLPGELFSEIWKYLPKLKQLQINHAFNVNGRHVSQLFTHGSEVMQNLTSIDFTGCWKITDEGIQAIADVCPELKHVILKACKSITDISRLLRQCLKIESLNVAFCYNIELKGLTSIPPKLTSFYVHKTEAYADIIRVMEEKRISIYICWSEYNDYIVKRTIPK